MQCSISGLAKALTTRAEQRCCVFPTRTGSKGGSIYLTVQKPRYAYSEPSTNVIVVPLLLSTITESWKLRDEPAPIICNGVSTTNCVEVYIPSCKKTSFSTSLGSCSQCSIASLRFLKCNILRPL
ncbi:unnamed protein product [Brugia timori]|uniref:Uncharacterized protein n=1 Tax=Brugia timori TaxID=42155 RepID=A0A3P7XRW3_9BILA|nr:unnamed protein product [Brugia timori]